MQGGSMTKLAEKARRMNADYATVRDAAKAIVERARMRAYEDEGDPYFLADEDELVAQIIALSSGEPTNG